MNPTYSFFNVLLKKLSDNNNDSLIFNEGLLKAYNEVCGYNENRKYNVNTWWWNSWAKDEIQMKKVPLMKPKMNTGDRRRQLLEL